MKNLLILLVMVFFILGCTTPTGEKTIEKTIIRDGVTWEIVGTNQQIYPTPIATASAYDILKQVLSGRKLYASDPVISPITIADDFEAKGIVYRQNSYSGDDSIYKDELHYIDVGSLVGHKQKLLIRVKYEMISQGNNANSPDIHIRAKGSNDPWEILNPSMTTSDVEFIVTDDVGVVEWYQDNGAPKIWENLTEGWVKIIGKADYYIIGNPIS